MQLLAELSTLPSDLTVREWVAHGGLDPAHEISGSSVRRASRISRAGNRHLRKALYMSALVASRCDPHAKAFFAWNRSSLREQMFLFPVVHRRLRSVAEWKATRIR
ncbi:IS110 family transposase [Tunturiibacter gelidiferens]|uniref:IS110 family transposase n=1 Tax=Tunturiibacter gelidiferens TaxID=3069689 RepID=UPI0033400AB0